MGRVSANTKEVDEEKMFGPWKGLSDEERADSFPADIQAAALKKAPKPKKVSKGKGATKKQKASVATEPDEDDFVVADDEEF